MTSFADIEGQIERASCSADAEKGVGELLRLGEQVLEQWIESRDQIPVTGKKEGFRLLALHRQGAKGEPSFNACRETCRELAYHYNLICGEPDHPDTPRRLALAGMIAKHLCLFVGGKMEVEKLGEFCCSSKAIRTGDLSA